MTLPKASILARRLARTTGRTHYVIFDPPEFLGESESGAYEVTDDTDLETHFAGITPDAAFEPTA